MKELALDTYVVPAEVIVPLLKKACALRSDDEQVARAMQLIGAWDFRSTTGSAAYTYIYFWGKAYQELYSAAHFARFLSPSRPSIDTDSREEQEKALAALKQALARIDKLFGRLEVPWGEVNVAVRRGAFPMDGTPLYGVLHPDQGIEQEGGRIHANDGWGHLLVVMEGEPKQIWSLLPYGQSEDPASPHYNDQARMHSQGRIKRFWFTSQEILDHTRSVWGDRERMSGLASPRRPTPARED